MEYGAIDLHKKESPVRILPDSGEVIDQRIRTTRDRLTAVFSRFRGVQVVCLRFVSRSMKTTDHLERDHLAALLSSILSSFSSKRFALKTLPIRSLRTGTPPRVW